LTASKRDGGERLNSVSENKSGTKYLGRDAVIQRIISEKIIGGRYHFSSKGESLMHLSQSKESIWPAPGSEDTELGVLMEPEVDHGTSEVYTRVQA
jgi:hypothetical protein